MNRGCQDTWGGRGNMRGDFRGGFRGFPHHGGAFRGRGGGNMNLFDGKSSQLALKAAEDHQCKNLAFDTKDPATIDSRVYVGNICKGKVARQDLYVIFSKYGTITAISHLTCRNPQDYCNFAFIQFTKKDSAERAAVSEDGHEYYGHNLDVKLAAFNKGEHSNWTKAPASSMSGTPLFSKRASTNTQVSSGPLAKRPRVDQDGPADILVCGICHARFYSIEELIRHKRHPCKSVKRCRCDEDGVPNVVSCAVCHKMIRTPWKLILHMHQIHDLEICSNVEGGTESQEGAGAESEDGGDGDDVDLENLDNALMEEEIEEGIM